MHLIQLPARRWPRGAPPPRGRRRARARRRAPRARAGRGARRLLGLEVHLRDDAIIQQLLRGRRSAWTVAGSMLSINAVAARVGCRRWAQPGAGDDAWILGPRETRACEVSSGGGPATDGRDPSGAPTLPRLSVRACGQRQEQGCPSKEAVRRSTPVEEAAHNKDTVAV